MTSSKGARRFEVILVAAVLAMHAYAALSDAYNLPNAWFSRDDAYYYFKVAQNITEGRGVSFDGINLTNGFHPLWMLICIPVFALARFDLVLPLRVLLILIAVLQAATLVLLFRLLRRALATPIAALAAAYWAFDLGIHYTYYEFGLETPLAAFGLVACLYLASGLEDRKRPEEFRGRAIAILAAAATLTALSRLDLAFFAVALGLWIVVPSKPLRLLLPADLLAFLAATSFAQAAIAGFPEYYAHAGSVVAAAAIAAAIRIPIFFLLRLYAHPRSQGVASLTGRVVLAVTASELILVPVLLIGQRSGLLAGLSRQGILLEALLTFPLVLGLRLCVRLASPSTKVHDATTPLDRIRTDGWGWLKEGAVFYGVLAGALGIYMAANRVAFGTWLPISAQIKRWWGTQIETIYDGPPRNLFAFFGIGLNSPLDAWQPATNYVAWLSRQLRFALPGGAYRDERDLLAIVLLIAAAFTIVVLRRTVAAPAIARLGLVPLFVGAGLQLQSYTALGYAGYKEWYWLPQRLLLTLLAAVLLHVVLSAVPTFRFGRTVAWSLSIALCVLLGARLWNAIYVKMPYGETPPDQPYMEVLTVLEAKTRPGTIIGMTGGGNVGYFIHDRVIVNMDGLINSEGYFRALREGTAAPYLSQKGVKVIFANPGLLALAPYHGQFAPYLERFDSYYGKALLWLLPERKY